MEVEILTEKNIGMYLPCIAEGERGGILQRPNLAFGCKEEGQGAHPCGVLLLSPAPAL